MRSNEGKAARLAAAHFWLEHDARYRLERSVGKPAPKISLADDGKVLMGGHRLSEKRSIPIYLLTGIILQRVGSIEVQDNFAQRASDQWPREMEQVLGVIDLHWDALLAEYHLLLEHNGTASAPSTEIEG